MLQFPLYTQSEIIEQRWYYGVAVALCVAMAVMIWKLPKLRFRGLAKLIWGGLPLVWCGLLNCGYLAGISSQILTWTFVVHCLLNLWGIFTEIRFEKYAIGLVVPLVMLVGIVLLLPGVTTYRWTADISSCRNNLKQIGLGIYNFDEVGDFQPVYGTPAVSWRVKILPFMDAKSLGTGYDPTQPWDTEPNRQVGMQEPTPYRCSAHREERSVNGLATTDYALITGPGTIFPTPDTVFDYKRVGDGTSNTIMAVECAGLRIPWIEPRDVDISRVRMTLNELGADGGSPSVVSSRHTNPSHEWHLINVLMADGSVKSFDPEQIDSALVQKMLTANGGEKIDF